MNVLRKLFPLRRAEIRNFSHLKMDSKDRFEYCVLCGKRLKILKDTPIHMRLFYVEGVGQLCGDCWGRIN